MNSMRARVRNGRLVLDEPTTLPEGAEVELRLVDGDDDLDAEERAELYESLREGIADLKAGRTVDAREAIARLARRA
jgi:hypothetical protein